MKLLLKLGVVAILTFPIAFGIRDRSVGQLERVLASGGHRPFPASPHASL